MSLESVLDCVKLGPMSKTKVITERFQLNRGVVVDRAAGTISGARICGENSANGRKYRPKVFEGVDYKVSCYLGHGQRTFENKIAKVIEHTPGLNGLPYGTLQIDLTDPYAQKLLNTAEKDPESIGLSHVAECESHFEGGIEIIDRILKVESVDIVLDPATNPKGLKGESRGAKKMATTTIKSLVEKYGPKLGAKNWLRWEKIMEMDAAVGDMETDTPADDTPPDQALADALKTLVAAEVGKYIAGDASAEDVGAKVVAYLKAHSGETDTADDTEPDGDETPKESKKKSAKPLTAEDVARITAEVFAAEIKKLSPAKAEGVEKPKSGSKLPPKKTAESEGDADDLPADPKALNESIKAAK